MRKYKQFALGFLAALFTAGLLVQITKPDDTRDIFWCAAVAFNIIMLLYVITEAWFSARN